MQPTGQWKQTNQAQVNSIKTNNINICMCNHGKVQPLSTGAWHQLANADSQLHNYRPNTLTRLIGRPQPHGAIKHPLSLCVCSSAPVANTITQITYAVHCTVIIRLNRSTALGESWKYSTWEKRHSRIWL